MAKTRRGGFGPAPAPVFADFSASVVSVEMEPGAVAWHEDEGGSHLAFILDVQGNDCLAVFFTSNSAWGQRRATRDELALAGYAATRPTYLSPVVRRKKWEFESRDFQLPAHRLEQLRSEFARAA